MRDRGLQEVDEGARRRRVLGDDRERAGAEHRLAEIRLAGIGRHVEEVRVRADLGALREEGGDERRLVVHVALRRRGEEALRALAEVGRGDRRGAAVDELVVLGEPAELVERGDDALVGERNLVRDPLVVDFRRLRAQHQVLDPVGRRPAGRAARAETDAPRRAAVGDDLLGQRLQVLHRRRHFVAGVLEVLRHVPDEALHIDLVGEAVEGGRSVLALVGAERRPRTGRRRSCRGAISACRRRAESGSPSRRGRRSGRAAAGR